MTQILQLKIQKRKVVRMGQEIPRQSEKDVSHKRGNWNVVKRGQQEDTSVVSYVLARLFANLPG